MPNLETSSQDSPEVLPDAVIGENEGEYDTEEIIHVDGDFFYRRVNGGYKGAYQSRGNAALECREISRSEARCLLLSFGLEPEEVAGVAA